MSAPQHRHTLTSKSRTLLGPEGCGCDLMVDVPQPCPPEGMPTLNLPSTRWLRRALGPGSAPALARATRVFSARLRMIVHWVLIGCLGLVHRLGGSSRSDAGKAPNFLERELCVRQEVRGGPKFASSPLASVSENSVLVCATEDDLPMIFPRRKFKRLLSTRKRSMSRSSAAFAVWLCCTCKLVWLPRGRGGFLLSPNMALLTGVVLLWSVAAFLARWLQDFACTSEQSCLW